MKPTNKYREKYKISFKEIIEALNIEPQKIFAISKFYNGLTDEEYLVVKQYSLYTYATFKIDIYTLPDLKLVDSFTSENWILFEQVLPEYVKLDSELLKTKQTRFLIFCCNKFLSIRTNRIESFEPKVDYLANIPLLLLRPNIDTYALYNIVTNDFVIYASKYLNGVYDKILVELYNDGIYSLHNPFTYSIYLQHDSTFKSYADSFRILTNPEKQKTRILVNALI